MSDNVIPLRKARIIAAAGKQRKSRIQRIKDHNARVLSELGLV